jgi:phospholipase/carboxylesterase
MVLHHGVGASAQDLSPLGQHLAAQFPNAFIVSVHAPCVGDTGSGAQWFSVQGITEENRPARVAEVMPAFIHNLRYWQQTSGVAASATAIVGFSQGAIMALEAAQAQAGLAARIVALSGRYAQLPTHAPEQTTLFTASQTPSFTTVTACLRQSAWWAWGVMSPLTSSPF